MVAKLKPWLGLAVALCVMAGSTATSFGAAYFPTTKQGPSKAFELKQKTTGIFSFNANSEECTKLTFKGIAPPASGSATLKLLPTWEGCKFSGETAKVTNEGCEFELLTPNGTHPKYTSNLSIKTNKASQCHIAQVATLFGISCTVTMQSETANENLKLMSYEDLTNNTGMQMKFGIVGLVYTATGGGCGLEGISSGTSGKFNVEVETEAVAIK